MKGGGCNRYLGNAQIDPAFFEVGLPLSTEEGGERDDKAKPNNLLSKSIKSINVSAILSQCKDKANNRTR